MLKMKKHAWLVALLLALSLAFFACGDNGNGEEEEEVEWDYEIPAGAVDIGPPSYNADATQAAWEFKDDTDPTFAQFLEAKYLVIVTGSPVNRGAALIWQGRLGVNDDFGGASQSPGDWEQNNILGNNGDGLSAAGVEREGEVITIELSKGLKDFDTRFTDICINNSLGHGTGTRIVAASWESPGWSRFGKIVAAYLLNE
jgi:hypothetical protein